MNGDLWKIVEVQPFKFSHYCRHVVITFSIGGPKPSCQSCRKHNECCEVNRNRRHRELGPDLEESLTKVAKISSNNGGFTAGEHREIKQFGGDAVVNHRKISQFWWIRSHRKR